MLRQIVETIKMNAAQHSLEVMYGWVDNLDNTLDLISVLVLHKEEKKIEVVLGALLQARAQASSQSPSLAAAPPPSPFDETVQKMRASYATAMRKMRKEREQNELQMQKNRTLDLSTAEEDGTNGTTNTLRQLLEDEQASDKNRASGMRHLNFAYGFCAFWIMYISFYIAIFSVSFGPKMTSKWLTDFFRAYFLNMFVLDPINIALSGIVVAPIVALLIKPFGKEIGKHAINKIAPALALVEGVDDAGIGANTTKTQELKERPPLLALVDEGVNAGIGANAIENQELKGCPPLAGPPTQ
jgi:hypothetical protein